MRRPTDCRRSASLAPRSEMASQAIESSQVSASFKLNTRKCTPSSQRKRKEESSRRQFSTRPRAKRPPLSLLLPELFLPKLQSKSPSPRSALNLVNIICVCCCLLAQTLSARADEFSSEDVRSSNSEEGRGSRSLLNYLDQQFEPNTQNLFEAHFGSRAKRRVSPALAQQQQPIADSASESKPFLWRSPSAADLDLDEQQQRQDENEIEAFFRRYRQQGDNPEDVAASTESLARPQHSHRRRWSKFANGGPHKRRNNSHKSDQHKRHHQKHGHTVRGFLGHFPHVGHSDNKLRRHENNLIGNNLDTEPSEHYEAPYSDSSLPASFSFAPAERRGQQQVPEQLPIVVSSSDNSYVSASPYVYSYLNTSGASNEEQVMSTTATTTSSGDQSDFDGDENDLNDDVSEQDERPEHKLEINRFAFHHFPPASVFGSLVGRHRKSSERRKASTEAPPTTTTLTVAAVEMRAQPQDGLTSTEKEELLIDGQRVAAIRVQFSDRYDVRDDNPAEFRASLKPSGVAQSSKWAPESDSGTKQHFSHIKQSSFANEISPTFQRAGKRHWHDSHISIGQEQPNELNKGGINSAIIAILFGIGATGMLIMIVGHKMNSIKRRFATKSCRRSLVPQTDFFINTNHI